MDRPATRRTADRAWPSGCLLLFELDQHPVRRRRVDEGDERTFGAGSRLLVDQANAARLELRQRGADVIDPQGDVMEPGSALLDVPGDGRIGGGPLEQLERRVSDRHEMGAHALRRDVLDAFDLEAERVAVERQCRLDVSDGDADVIENRLHLPLRSVLTTASALSSIASAAL